jgi:two-component system, chemotaxis family, chemotaxis protein CheY
MAQILVVDDSASMRNMVTATLQSAGHEVTDAGDGQAALNKAQSGKYDAVVTDLNMPIMDGIELVKNLRALPTYSTHLSCCSPQSQPPTKRLRASKLEQQVG